jgi:iron complex outermembrane recepter protein
MSKGKTSVVSIESLHRVIRRTLFIAAASGLGITVAQAQTPPPSGGEEAIGEVVVTGSRIASPNQASASPIQVVNAEAIRATGRNDISDMINQLPQISNNDLGQDLGNRTSGLTTAGGVATADLRGLGPNRTLVLVDGRRLGIGSPNTAIQSPAPDLDQIPMFMVERVEVLTGGASTTYGSDAVGGVVNFIMKKNFEGIQIDGQLGENWHDQHSDISKQRLTAFGEQPITGNAFDGRNKNFSVMMGANSADGRGNLTGYLNYYQQDPVASGERDWGQCQLSPNSIGGVNIDDMVCSGSSNSNFFNPLSGPNANNAYSVLGTSFVPNPTPGTNPPAAFNSQKYIFLQRDDSRYMAGLNGHYDLNDWVKPYIQMTFMDDRTHQEVAPSALFRGSNPNNTNSGNYHVNCGNPFLSAQEIGVLGCTPAQINAANQLDPANQVEIEIGRRNVEGGNRLNDFQHTNYRGVLGATGDITPSWTYDLYGQFYYVSYWASSDKYMNFANIDNALLATRGAGGTPVCVSGGPNCVPYNIFADGGVTSEALNYLQTTGTQRGESTLRTFHFDITGHLGDYGVKLPTASEGVAINVGLEHRNENVTLSPDAVEQSGQLSGFGSAVTSINASQSVNEQFIEVRVPILSDMKAAKDLVFSTGFRRSDYSTSGAVNTYKFDLQWQPIDDIRFRGSYNKAIRAASIVELFNQPLVALIQLGNDPCAPSAPGLHDAPSTLAQCLNTVSPAQAAAFTAAYNAGTIPNSILGQLSQQTAGNPDLKPEDSDSYTVGFVFTPQIIPGLQGSLDWWDIKIKDEIGVIPANLILSQCLASGTASYCSQIVRQPNNFSLTGNAVATGGYIIQQNFNIGFAEVEGIDLQTSYHLPVGGAGNLGFSLNGSYLLKNETQPLAGSPSYDCVGLFGSTCQTVSPRWRHIFSTNWETPWNFSLGMNWRFIGKVGLDNNDHDPSLYLAAQGAFNTVTSQFGNTSYFDLFGTWHVRDNFELRAGINNITDKDPPLVSFDIAPGGTNTYSTYDSLGRQMYLSFTVKL